VNSVGSFALTVGLSRGPLELRWYLREQTTASGIRGPARAPLNGAELSVTQEVVGEADGLHRLVPVRHAVKRTRVAGRDEVLEPDRVRAVYAHGEARVPAGYDFPSNV
jgi:hypothetical protein